MTETIPNRTHFSPSDQRGLNNTFRGSASLSLQRSSSPAQVGTSLGNPFLLLLKESSKEQGAESLFPSRCFSSGTLLLPSSISPHHRTDSRLFRKFSHFVLGLHGRIW